MIQRHTENFSKRWQRWSKSRRGWPSASPGCRLMVYSCEFVLLSIQKRKLLALVSLLYATTWRGMRNKFVMRAEQNMLAVEGHKSGVGRKIGVIMVTPLHLAITPMRVLQDPEFGTTYAKLFEEGDVDDRLLMILFLMVERIRGSSSLWAPYLDVLPTSFGTPLWFTEEELQELKGTTLYNATRIQLKNLKALFADKVKAFTRQLLSAIGAFEREIVFEDFLWANCIFWTRALNIPCPHSFVFPHRLPVSNVDVDSQSEFGGSGNVVSTTNKNVGVDPAGEEYSLQVKKDVENHSFVDGSIKVKEQIGLSKETEPETVWVEGLVPGIDFCNHAPGGLAVWEVDGAEGSTTGTPNSMYLKTDERLLANDEILISYGNKGNEELLFLYGFVTENNVDDYFMVHFPKEALDQDPCGDLKVQLLQNQGLTLRWLLPYALLHKGFFSSQSVNSQETREAGIQACQSSFSWSGNRKLPSYSNNMVFPEETIAALRVVAMKEIEVQTLLSMLDELSQSGLKRAPTAEDVQAAVWEVCGDSGALQLLTDLLSARLLDLEEGTGKEEADQKLLDGVKNEPGFNGGALSKNKRACVIYRKGQKYLAKHFLKESEHLLELCISEEKGVREAACEQ